MSKQINHTLMMSPEVQHLLALLKSQEVDVDVAVQFISPAKTLL